MAIGSDITAYNSKKSDFDTARKNLINNMVTGTCLLVASSTQKEFWALKITTAQAVSDGNVYDVNIKGPGVHFKTLNPHTISGVISDMQGNAGDVTYYEQGAEISCSNVLQKSTVGTADDCLLKELSGMGDVKYATDTINTHMWNDIIGS